MFTVQIITLNQDLYSNSKLNILPNKINL